MAVNFFATLLLAHLLADFPLQTNTIAALKSKSVHGLLMHVGVYMAATWALLGFGLTICPLIMLLGIAHFAVDWLKVRTRSQKPVRSFVFISPFQSRGSKRDLARLGISNPKQLDQSFPEWLRCIASADSVGRWLISSRGMLKCG